METHTPHPAARLLLPLVMGAAVMGLYVNTIVGFDGYTPYLRDHMMIDDVPIILEVQENTPQGHMLKQRNPTVTHPHGYYRLWAQDYWAGRSTDHNLYRPVTVLSYWVNSFVTGLAPVPWLFRLVNILLLWLLGVLTAWWLSRYLEHPAGAWLAAFLFVAHPVNAELINQVVGRADILAMIGVVGFALAQRRAQMDKRWSPLLAVGAVLSAAIAVGSKETGLLVFPVAIVQGWLVRTEYRRTDMALRQRVRVTSLLLAGLPSVAYLAARFVVVGFGREYPATKIDDLTGNPLRGLGLFERLPATLSIVWFYFKQLFNPDTTFNHNPIDVPTWSDSSTIAGLFVALGFIALFALALRRRHWTTTVLVIALGQYLLVGNVVRPVGVYAANRLMLPFLLAAAGMVAVMLARLTRGSRRAHAAAIIPIAAVCVWMSWTVFTINTCWYSIQRVMAYEHAVHSTQPASMYLYGRAQADVCLQEGVTREECGKAMSNAIRLLQLAVNLKPQSVEARWLLSQLYFATGRYDESFNEAYEIHEKLDATNLDALIQLAVLQMMDKRLPEAHIYLHKARQIAPTDARVMHNWAILAVAEGNKPEAIARYQALLKEYPKHPQGQRELAELASDEMHWVEWLYQRRREQLGTTTSPLTPDSPDGTSPDHAPDKPLGPPLIDLQPGK